MSTVNPWRPASRVGANNGSGGEQIARAAAAQIIQNLPSQCDLQNDDWAARDADWAKLLDLPYQQTTIQPVPKDRIYLGAQPTLVAGKDAKWDKWPAITVRCGVRSPTPLDQLDQSDMMSNELIVEVLARVGPFKKQPVDERATSDAVDRYYQRLSDAVIGCINADRSLSQNCFPIQLPPTQTPSLPWVRPASIDATDSGGWLVYQAMELVWMVQTIVVANFS